MKTSAEREKYYDDLKGDFDQLEAKLKHNKQADLQKFSDEVRSLLRSEIVTRYYAQKGRIEAMVTEDPEIKKAIEILDDSTGYQHILVDTEVPAKIKS